MGSLHIVVDFAYISAAAATSARTKASNSSIEMGRKAASCSATAICPPETIHHSRSGEKLVWIWTENKQVMTAAVERGWNTFIFPSNHRHLAAEWSSLAYISPFFIEEGEVFDDDDLRVGVYKDVSSPLEIEKLQSLNEDQLIILHLHDWQVIPAENIIAAFQRKNTVLAVSKSPSEAQVFLQALEQGMGGVVLKVDDVDAILEMKEYFRKRIEGSSKLDLTKVTVTGIQTCGMGDRVCVDLCSLMKPGEGLLVGSFARGLFLVHSECMESNYISSRPFRVNAGPVHAYVAIPGGKTKYLSELNTGMEVTVVDHRGMQRTAIVGRVKVETRPLILVEAKPQNSENVIYSILLQNAETVALISPVGGEENRDFLTIPVTSLKIGDEILLRIQGGARHTGIEIQEFILEK